MHCCVAGQRGRLGLQYGSRFASCSSSCEEGVRVSTEHSMSECKHPASDQASLSACYIKRSTTQNLALQLTVGMAITAATKPPNTIRGVVKRIADFYDEM